MNLSFRPIDFQNRSELELIARWQNDPETRRLSQPNFGEAEKDISVEEIYERNSKIDHGILLDELILCNGDPIGFCDIQLNPQQCLIKEGKVAWLALVIAEPTARGKGIGEQVMNYLFHRAKEARCDWAEAGAFAFNLASLKLLKKVGMEEFARLENFTFWDGKRWADIRFRLRLK